MSFKTAAAALLLGVPGASAASGASGLRQCVNYAQTSRGPNGEVRGIPSCTTYKGKKVSTALTAPDSICTEKGVHGFIYGPDSDACIFDYPEDGEEEEDMLITRRRRVDADLGNEAFREMQSEIKKAAAAAAATAAAAAASAASSAASSAADDAAPRGDFYTQWSDKKAERERTRKKRNKKKNRGKKRKIVGGKLRLNFLKEAIEKIENDFADNGIDPVVWQAIKDDLNEKVNGVLTARAEDMRDKILIKVFGEKWATQPNFGWKGSDRAESIWRASAGSGISNRQRKKISKLAAGKNWGWWWTIFKLFSFLQAINGIMVYANQHDTYDMEWEGDDISYGFDDEGGGQAFLQTIEFLKNMGPRWLFRLPAQQSLNNLSRFIGAQTATMWYWSIWLIGNLGLTSWASVKSLGRNVLWMIIIIIGIIPGGEQLSEELMLENFPGDVVYFTDSDYGTTHNQGRSPFLEELNEIWSAQDEDDEDDGGYYDYGGGYKHQTQKRKRKRKRKKKSKKRRRKKHKKTKKKY